MAGIPYVKYPLCIDEEYSLYGMPAIFVIGDTIFCLLKVYLLCRKDTLQP